MPADSRPSSSDIGGLVLAGGRGRRFGGPKASVAVGPGTLVERAVAALGPCCSEVVVASRADVALPPLGARVVLDAGEPSALRGLASGLSALTTTHVLVLACDLVVQRPVVERLLAASGDAAVALDDHGVQPLCARYRRTAALAACRRLLDEGDLRARRLVDILDATTVPVSPEELRNVNTWPDGFAAALDVPALSPGSVELILRLTRDVAHGTERPNGPVASFLAGLAAGRRGADVEDVLHEAIAAVPGLLPDRGTGT